MMMPTITNSMNVLTSNYDVIFFGIIIFSAILALIRGAVSEILSLSVWFIAFAVMRHYGTFIDSKIPQSITSELLRGIIVFIAAFIVVAILIALVKKLCASIISKIGLGGLNYLLGAAFGVIRGILICAILIIVIEILKLDPSHSWQHSRLSGVLTPVVDWITKSIPSQLQDLPKPPTLIPSYNI